MKYTEQEIEMLAHFLSEAHVGERLSDAFVDRAKLDVQLALSGESIARGGSTERVVRAALRLMREAREQGAAEMRERAAAEIPTWSRQIGTDSDVLRDRILALPLTIPRDC